MADQIARRNERIRAIAEKAGRATYQHELVEYWPACTTCGKPIRPSLWNGSRLCGCPDVLWRCTPHGWERIDPPAARPVRDTPTPTPTSGEEPTDA